MNKDINESLKLDISALLDGELDELGCARVLSSTDNPQLREKVQRYSVLQSLLHSEDIALTSLSSDISMRVHQALDNEVSDLSQDAVSEAQQEFEHRQSKEAKKSASPMAWFKPAVGFAMAASVAFLMVFSVDYWRAGDSPAVAAVQQQTQPQVFNSVARNNGADSNDYLGSLLRSDPSLVSHVSLAEQELNDPFQVVVAADQELRKREQILLKAHQENTQMQQHLREYLIRHTRQSASNPVNNMLPIARASHQEYSE